MYHLFIYTLIHQVNQIFNFTNFTGISFSKHSSSLLLLDDDEDSKSSNHSNANQAVKIHSHLFVLPYCTKPTLPFGIRVQFLLV